MATKNINIAKCISETFNSLNLVDNNPEPDLIH